MNSVSKRLGFVGSMLLSPLFVACMNAPMYLQGKPTAPPPTPLAAKAEIEEWRRHVPSSGTAGQVKIPSPQLTVLPNGMSVYVLPHATGVVSLSVVVRQGAESIQQGKSGLVPLVARMLTESTRRHNPFQLAEAAEAFGSTLNSIGQRDSTEVSLDALPGDCDRAIELLAEVLRDPAFDEKDFERVRAQWLDDLLAERQSPASLASMVALRALFGTYRGAPVNGSVSDVKTLQLSDLKAWHKTHVVPSQAALIVAGPVAPDTVLKSAQQYFGTWHAANSTLKDVVYSAAPKGSHQIIVVDRKGAVQSALLAVQAFPRRQDPGHEARLLLSDVFGGLFTSRINMNLREAHAYTYGAHSTVIANRHFGLFMVQTSVRTDVTAESIKELLAELSAIAAPKPSHPIEPDELGRARADLVHRLGAHLEQNRILASDVASVFSHNLGKDYFARLPEVYSGLGLEAITSQQSLIQADKLTLVIVGDQKAIEPSLTKAGFSVVTPESGWLD